MTNKLSAKFFEIFRLKSDAVPRPPRQSQSSPGSETPTTESFNENVNNAHQQEDQFGEKKKSKKKDKPKYKKSFSAPPSDTPEFEENETRNNTGSNVNTQASGNVINIVNSKNVRCGNEFVYYMGPVQGQHNRSRTPPSDDDCDDEPVKKNNLILLLLEAENKPEHEYMDYISKHLGKNWHSFFRRLGYKQGQIETAEIDMAKYGVGEARYKLLLDWVRNDDDGTLGKLANVLWDDGQRQIVKELATLYSRKN